MRDRWWDVDPNGWFYGFRLVNNRGKCGVLSFIRPSLDFGVSGRALVLDKICVTVDGTSFPMDGFMDFGWEIIAGSVAC